MFCNSKNTTIPTKYNSQGFPRWGGMGGTPPHRPDFGHCPPPPKGCPPPMPVHQILNKSHACAQKFLRFLRAFQTIYAIFCNFL